MPTTVHIPPTLLESVDRRAKALGVSRNRLIVRALEDAVGSKAEWTPEFLEQLRKTDEETRHAADDLATAIRRNRRSKRPPRL